MADKDESVHIRMAPGVLYLLIGAAGIGGLGGGSFIAPKLERSALEACFDNSQIAINVAAQHGEEIQDIRTLLLQRTSDRYTSADARKDWREQYKRDQQQDRTIELIEKELK